MRYLILLFLLLTACGLLVSCDPGFRYFVGNHDKELILELHPSLEAVYCPELPETCSYATLHRIGETAGGALYKVNAGEMFKIYSGIGTKASVNLFPFDFFMVVLDKDTLMLHGKIEILKMFKQGSKSNMYYFDFKELDITK